jgi:hypothetical protein
MKVNPNEAGIVVWLSNNTFQHVYTKDKTAAMMTSAIIAKTGLVDGGFVLHGLAKDASNMRMQIGTELAKMEEPLRAKGLHNWDISTDPKLYPARELATF